MKTPFFGCLLALLCAGCSKPAEAPLKTAANKFSVPPMPATVIYIIKKGDHNCNGNALQWIDTASLNFSVRFDSSAVYTTQVAANQYDINKLYGFSDGGVHHHQASARFGWRWSEGALRLFAYVYNGGQRQEQELGTVPIGSWVACALAIAGNQYLFTLNGATTSMPRTSTTPKAQGYLLYPYFGGDEAAPHDVRIEIRTAD